MTTHSLAATPTTAKLGTKIRWRILGLGLTLAGVALAVWTIVKAWTTPLATGHYAVLINTPAHYRYKVTGVDYTNLILLLLPLAAALALCSILVGISYLIREIETGYTIGALALIALTIGIGAPISGSDAAAYHDAQYRAEEHWASGHYGYTGSLPHDVYVVHGGKSSHNIPLDTPFKLADREGRNHYFIYQRLNNGADIHEVPYAQAKAVYDSNQHALAGD